MASYQYHPLRHDEIRVLKLLPGEAFVDLQCDLLHVPLDRPESYEALSYTWGNVEESQLMTSGETRFGITANLYQALVHLRHKDRARFLWADALCDDTPERNEQVKKMARIYSSASEVIIWLGQNEKDIKEAFQIIPRVYNYITEHADNYMPNHHLNVGLEGPRAP
ncbi:HET-domain-containing [Fusarium albosuccineum]|uniref:HET-domain-containing n=1 Tax=Fusarium albosuccineum TaxID=1237068 RepID=A0A8H4LLM9_9HYPO|nr:HET-domain-containing [Fusarium albosuccineum]